jgi:hypothetical protein
LRGERSDSDFTETETLGETLVRRLGDQCPRCECVGFSLQRLFAGRPEIQEHLPLSMSQDVTGLMEEGEPELIV